MFIPRAPFSDCSACLGKATEGLMSIANNRVLRRCRACGADRVRELPQLRPPAVLYLDQFAVSNLAKSAHPSFAHRFAEGVKQTHDGFWPRLHGRVERLVKAGLLVCPPSSIHYRETALAPALREPIMRLHQHLAGTLRFKDHTLVRDHQLRAAFCAHLDGTTVRPTSILEGEHEWPNLMTITARFPLTDDELELVRQDRAAARIQMAAIMDEWRRDGARTWEERRDEQLAGFGPGLLDMSPLSTLRVLLNSALSERAVPYERRAGVIIDFLRSPAAMVPYARLAAGLVASLGWQTARSQAKAADDGLVDDIRAIAAYAPACDSMLVDRQWLTLMTQSPLKNELPTTLTVFGLDSREALESWLTDLEAAAPSGHFDLVYEVYGPGWLTTYREIVVDDVDD